MAGIVLSLLLVLAWFVLTIFAVRAIARQRSAPGLYLVQEPSGRRFWCDDELLTERYEELLVIRRRLDTPEAREEVMRPRGFIAADTP